MGSSQKHRLFYIDNLRIYLLILVFLTHTSIAYGGVGDWGVRDPAVDNVSPLFLSIFNAVNQSYFMSAFFLLAGYFTPRSVERKGPPQFLKDRVIRLVIPLIFYPILIAPINEYLIRNFMYYQNISIWTIIDRRISHLEFGVGHLWFLQALLIFAIIYVVCRALADRNLKKLIQIYHDTFPPNAIHFLCIGVLTVLTFTVRLVFPVGVWFLNLQLGHFVHYTFCFFSGVLAYRGNWFRRLSGSQARLWGVMSLVVIPLLFVIVILGGVVENVEKIMGGFYWQAFMYATWESFLMVGIIVFLLYVFRERLNEAGPIAKSMAANVYTVYIIHQTILYALQISMLSVNILTIVKFFIVSLIAVPMCFLISHFIIRKIPYATRVLG